MARQKTGIDTLIAKARVIDVEISNDLPDMEGVFTLNDRHFIQQNQMTFEVSSAEPGPDMHLILASGSHTAQPAYKIRRNLDNNEWEVKHAPTGSPSRWEPLSPSVPVPRPDSPIDLEHPYELPSRHRARAAAVINSRGRYQEPLTGTYRDPEVDRTRLFFYQVRLRLVRDAKAFFSTVTLTPRPAIPQLAPAASHAEILRQVYAQSPGLVVGENHYSIASKKFLIDNMPELVKNDVKTLYLEHLQTDFHQADLDTYGHTQHHRHQPPWQSRPWVLEPELRRKKIGQSFDCGWCAQAADSANLRN